MGVCCSILLCQRLLNPLCSSSSTVTSLLFVSLPLKLQDSLAFVTRPIASRCTCNKIKDSQTQLKQALGSSGRKRERGARGERELPLPSRVSRARSFLRPNTSNLYLQLTVSYLIHIKKHCAHIYSHDKITVLTFNLQVGVARIACDGVKCRNGSASF